MKQISDEVNGWWFLTVSVGDVTPPTWETGIVYTISHIWQSLEWGSCVTDYFCSYAGHLIRHHTE